MMGGREEQVLWCFLVWLFAWLVSRLRLRPCGLFQVNVSNLVREVINQLDNQKMVCIMVRRKKIGFSPAFLIYFVVVVFPELS